MADTYPPSDDQPSPEEITQQTKPSPQKTEEEAVTQQTRVAPEADPQHPMPETVIASSRPSAATIQPPRRTVFRRLGHTLYSKDTRVGRFNRSAVAVLVTILVLFAVWTIAAFFLVYQPLNSQLADLRAAATQTANQLTQSGSDQKAADQKAQVASTQAAKDRSRLQLELTHVELLRVQNALTATRLAVASKDTASATKSLAEAEKRLTSLYPALEKQDSRQVETLKALFTVTKNDLTREDNPSLVDQDLQRMQNELNLAEEALQKE